MSTHDSKGVSVGSIKGVSEDGPKGVSVGGPKGVSVGSPKGVSVGSPKGVSISGSKGVSEGIWSKELSLCPLQRSVVGNLWDDHDALLSPAGSYKTHGGGSLEIGSLLDCVTLGGRSRSSSRALRDNGDGDDSSDDAGVGGSGDDSDDASLAYTPMSTSSSSINRFTHHIHYDPVTYTMVQSYILCPIHSDDPSDDPIIYALTQFLIPWPCRTLWPYLIYILTLFH